MRPRPYLRTRLTCCWLVVAAFASSTATTAEELGRITGFLDGEPTAWHTITMQQGGRTVATASVVQGVRLTELYVQGHPEARFGTAGLLSLEARYTGTYAPGATPLSVDVLFMPDGMGGPFWTSRGAARAPVLDIVSLEIWGNFGRLEAVFDAQLCLRPIISAATDPDTCRKVTGVIETELSAE
ncbi:hypothetical protein [Psychromarinibacter halotolerans]|uniref:Uncharacterized protein n=1 Tax=Psychromarinibacter halotolerans TaxID=1775175 RepID=A0ABV7GXX4_9RHOB|nr:hypothetical protein [Psychromarinibacter halotolerans]MDF0598311.1 hypothetical protein [Psychromarinibacter halotolerans]